MKKIVFLPGSNVYHEQDCHHLRRTPESKWKTITVSKAEKRKMRPCKCCGTVNFHLRHEEKALNKFVQGKDMEFKIVQEAMYVKTDIGCWKILYSLSSRSYSLYHRNNSMVPVNFQHPEKENYHRQIDKQPTATLAELFPYIRSHDAFRKAERDTGGDLKRMNVSLKYRQQYMNRQRRQQRRRIDNLFAAIERQHPEYAALAFC